MTPSNETAIAFDYRVLTSATTSDSWGALTAATAAGVTVAAGANKMIAVRVRAQSLTEGYPFVRLQLDEVANAAVDAAVVAILSGPKHAGASLPTAVA
ncbi:MAG: hypothetical protein GY851_09920 [bacterium]|nr:hypothetical protein [bacterium]